MIEEPMQGSLAVRTSGITEAARHTRVTLKSIKSRDN